MTIETLERRQLMSVSLSSSGELDITGTSGNDSIIINLIPNDASHFKVKFNGSAQIFATSSVNLISVNGGAGNDAINVKDLDGPVMIPAVLDGAGGADTITGASGADTLISGNGTDSLQAGAGANALDGGSGRDTLVGGSGFDVLQSGPGANVLTGGSGSDTLIAKAGDSVTTHSSQNLVSTDGGSSFVLQGLQSPNLPGNVASASIQITTDLQAAPAVALPPALLGPEQLRTYYGFPSLGASTSANLGQGQTIAVILPGDDPTAMNDLTVFSQTYGLPLPTPQSFQRVFAGGSAPPVDPEATSEDSLDIEYVHAIAPDAKIVLVEADYENVTNAPPGGSALRALNFEFSTTQFAQALEAAGNILTNSPSGGGVVSMSFGVSELATTLNVTNATLDPVLQDAGFEYAIDNVFAQYQNVSWVASSGDNGVGDINYPAMSPYVTAVGGTAVTLDSDGDAVSGETVWPESGGGVSFVEPEPLYQQEFVGPTVQIPLDVSLPASNDAPEFGRVGPDVAFLSDGTLVGSSAQGVAVYDSTPTNGFAGWINAIGTSLASPMFAATVALGNQVRAAAGEGVIGENLNNTIYYMNFEFGTRDFTHIGGVNFTQTDQVGWGTPVVSAFVNDLATIGPVSFTAPALSEDVDNVNLKVQAEEYYGIDDPTSSLNENPEAFPGSSSTLVLLPGDPTEVPIYQSGVGSINTIGPNIVDLSLDGFDTEGFPMFENAATNPLNPDDQFDVGDFTFNPATGQFSGVAAVTLDSSEISAVSAGQVENPLLPAAGPPATTTNTTAVSPDPFGAGLFVTGTISDDGTSVSGSFYTVIFNENGTFQKLGPEGGSLYLPDLEGSFGT